MSGGIPGYQGLCSAPGLAFADFSRPFILHTDAGGVGLGVVLYQEQKGKEWVISYASQLVTKSKSQYAAHKLNFWALKWYITVAFHDYLYGNILTVKSYNNSLTYVLTTAHLDAMGHWWVAQLATYNFNIQYKVGKTNFYANML